MLNAMMSDSTIYEDAESRGESGTKQLWSVCKVFVEAAACQAEGTPARAPPRVNVY
jgi:hypothetical protein